MYDQVLNEQADELIIKVLERDLGGINQWWSAHMDDKQHAISVATVVFDKITQLGHVEKFIFFYMMLKGTESIERDIVIDKQMPESIDYDKEFSIWN